MQNPKDKTVISQYYHIKSINCNEVAAIFKISLVEELTDLSVDNTDKSMTQDHVMDNDRSGVEYYKGVYLIANNSLSLKFTNVRRVVSYGELVIEI